MNTVHTRSTRGILTIAAAIGLASVGTSAAAESARPANPFVRVVAAPSVIWPGGVDSNSPVHWSGTTLNVFISHPPERYSGTDQSNLVVPGRSITPTFSPDPTKSRWIEATWVAPNGVLYAWYHHETFPCPGTAMAVPQIGALRSTDNGASFEDLGIVMSAPASDINCAAQNGYFAGGNGDFSVILDQAQEYFYFLFGTYSGPLTEQGVGLARMHISSLDSPVGSVWKYYGGAWTAPGLEGRATAVLPVASSWEGSAPDAFWGPSVHWNTYLNQYVILLNHASGGGWKQEGVYISASPNLANPSSLSKPVKILPASDWYAQVIGVDAEARETDKLAGRVARLYVGGASYWELVFKK